MSLSVLNRNRQLLIFPILSGAAALLVAVSFYIPVWKLGLVDEWVAEGSGKEQGTAGFYITLFFFYLANYFVIIFFNSALIFSVLRLLEGGSISVKQALADAFSVVHHIFAWAVVSAIVGVVLNALERHRGIGRLVSSLIGTAWTALTYFVLPVIIVERAGPATAIKRSLAILRNHWGTALVGNFSIGFIGFLILLPVFLLGGLLIFIGLQAATTFAMVLNLTLAAAIIITGFAADAALGHIFRTILYRYSTGQSLPDTIPTHDLEHAFATDSESK